MPLPYLAPTGFSFPVAAPEDKRNASSPPNRVPAAAPDASSITPSL